MNTRGNLYSNFFLLFGLGFTVLIYFGIKFIPVLQYLNKNYLYLFICLILLVLFLVIALFSKKLSFLCIKLRLCLNKNKNITELSNEISVQKSKDDISKFVSKFRQVINTFAIKKYSNESIGSLMNSVGLDKTSADNVVKLVKKNRKIRKLIYILGLIVSITLYFLMVYSPLNKFIANSYIPLLIAFVIFMLFSLESILVTKMPDSFYIKLMNINQDKIIELNNKMLFQTKELENTKKEVSKTLENLNQVISYLLDSGITKSDIVEILKKYGLNEVVANDFVSKTESQANLNKSKKVPALKNILKLSLTKIHEDFLSLKELYSKIETLNSQVTNLSEKQTKLESIVKQKENQVSNDKTEIIKNKIKYPLPKKVPNYNKFSIENDDKYQEMLDDLYYLLYPYAQNNTMDKFISIMVSTGYSYELATDLSEKFEKNNIFKKKKVFLDILVDFVNGTYEKISTKKK